MKRIAVSLLLTASVFAYAGTVVAAPKFPNPGFETFRAKIHVAGGITITSTFDSTGKCSPGRAWTMVESVDLEINDKVTGQIMPGHGIASRFASGNVRQKSRVKNYRTTNYCPPSAPVKLEKPDCDSFGGRSLANLIPDARFNGKISLGITRRGAGSQDLSCVSGAPVSKPEGTAVTVLHHTFTPINVPLNVKFSKFGNFKRGDKIIRVIRIAGKCSNVKVTTGGPGVVKAAADETCNVNGLFNVIVTRLDN